MEDNPCIICVAITGSVPRKEDNPNIPISVDEQIESTHEAFEAGASIVHCHVRNEDQSVSSDPILFAKLQEGIEKHCSGMVIQFSTGGRSGKGKERGGMLPISPDMASLTVGSNNFPTRVYENSPEIIDWLAKEMVKYGVQPEIEAFDLSHIFQAAKMYNEGKLKGNPYIQFVMGVKNAMPVDRDVFEYYIKTVNRILPSANWCAAGIGKHQKTINQWCIELGGHTRTGMEDNIRLDKENLAPSNAALVNLTSEICGMYGRSVATWEQTREILNIPLRN
ncbi:MAG: 3-keto-5-aminohexanoate cleavage protein [Pseudomonadota bacterium]|nr:3-keto-5-aminohexanoate cleavage protein [Pseudomonadota bacterium]